MGGGSALRQAFIDLRTSIPVRALLYPVGSAMKRKTLQAYYDSGLNMELAKYKGLHEGERCFIIGNGPSLNVCDLEALVGEITFACNRIYGLFEDTWWRPIYYFCIDSDVISSEYDAMLSVDCAQKFIDFPAAEEHGAVEGVAYIVGNPKFIVNFSNYTGPRIEEDPTRGFSYGATVTFTMIQTAIYMGFREIYLIGQDFSMPYYRDRLGIPRKTGETRAHFEKGDIFKRVYLNKYTNLNAFGAARAYCDAHGIVIRNCTRGGKLEVFERETLEDVLGRPAPAREKGGEAR